MMGSIKMNGRIWGDGETSPNVWKLIRGDTLVTPQNILGIWRSFWIVLYLYGRDAAPLHFKIEGYPYFLSGCLLYNGAAPESKL